MIIDAVDALAEAIRQNKDELLGQWREQVKLLPSAQGLDLPALNDHVPTLVGELVRALRAKSDAQIDDTVREGSSPAHGVQRLSDGFDLEEVVAEYNILRNCIHELANVHEINLQGPPVRILNQIIDTAIGIAVQAYANQQTKEIQQRREEYLAFVVHDLRTPLNAIALATGVLEEAVRTQPQGLKALSEAESSRMLKALRRNVRQLEGLVAKVMEENTSLQTDGGVKLQRRNLDLWSMVEGLIHEVQPIATTSRTTMVNDVPEDVTVFADASLLRRVLQNLLGNAIHYTPRGEVRIGAKMTQIDGAVECWVTDNGAGIPAALIDKVFDKFEGDPANESGWGLGLAIVKTFIEAHGGIVAVDSREGEGATFRFTVPGA